MTRIHAFGALVLLACLTASAGGAEIARPPATTTLVFDAVANGLVADGVDAASCVGENPRMCGTPGTGTDNTAQFAALIDKIKAAPGIGEIYFGYSGTGIYRGLFLVDEDYITIRCAAGVDLLPPFDASAGGYIVRFIKSGFDIESPRIARCRIRDDDAMAHGENWTQTAYVDSPTGGQDGDVLSVANYNAVFCAGTCSLEDLTLSGTFTGSDVMTVVITVQSESTPDTFDWTLNGRSGWRDNEVDQNMVASVELLMGVTIEWGATTGHTAGDTYTFKLTPDLNTVVVTDGAHGLLAGEACEIDLVDASYDGWWIVTKPIIAPCTDLYDDDGAGENCPDDGTNETTGSPNGYCDTGCAECWGADCTIYSFNIRHPFTSTSTGTFQEAPKPGQDCEHGAGWTDTCEIGRYYMDGAPYTGNLIQIEPTTGTLANGESIRLAGGAGWTVANATSTTTEVGNAMRGIGVVRGVTPKVEDNWLIDIGGAGLVIEGQSNEPSWDAVVKGNRTRNVPSRANKESAMEFREVVGADISDNDIDCGVSGGFQFQQGMAFATAPGVTAGPTDIRLTNNRVYDSSTERIDRCEAGIVLQPNATGVPFDGFNIVGGVIKMDHKYDDYDMAQGSIVVGASGSPILNLTIDGTTLEGNIDINGHTESTMLFSDFRVTGHYGLGLLARGASVQIDNGHIENFTDRCFQSWAGASPGDVSVSLLNCVDVGQSQANGIAMVQANDPAPERGFFHADNVTITMFPAEGVSQYGVSCDDNLNSRVTNLKVFDSTKEGVRECFQVVNPTVVRAQGNYALTLSLDGSSVLGGNIIDAAAFGVSINGDGIRVIGMGIEHASGNAVRELGGDYNSVTGNVSWKPAAIGGTFKVINGAADGGCDGSGTGAASACAANVRRTP